MLAKIVVSGIRPRNEHDRPDVVITLDYSPCRADLFLAVDVAEGLNFEHGVRTRPQAIELVFALAIR